MAFTKLYVVVYLVFVATKAATIYISYLWNMLLFRVFVYSFFLLIA